MELRIWAIVIVLGCGLGCEMDPRQVPANSGASPPKLAKVTLKPGIDLAFDSYVDYIFPGNRNGGPRDPRPPMELLTELRSMNDDERTAFEESLLGRRYMRGYQFGTYGVIWPAHYRSFALKAIARGRTEALYDLMKVAQPEDLSTILPSAGQATDELDVLLRPHLTDAIVAFHRKSPTPKSAYLLGKLAAPEDLVRSTSVIGNLRGPLLDGLATSDTPESIVLVDEITRPDNPREMGYRAARRLRMGERGIPFLQEMLNSGDRRHWDIARELLVQMPSERAVQIALDAGFGSPYDGEVAGGAIKNGPGAVDRYIVRAFRVGGTQERRNAMLFLERMRSRALTDYRTYLFQAARDRDPEVRERAVDLILGQDFYAFPEAKKAATPVLEAALADPSPQVRSRALFHVRAFASPQLLKTVERLARDRTQPSTDLEVIDRAVKEIRRSLEDGDGPSRVPMPPPRRGGG